MVVNSFAPVSFTPESFTLVSPYTWVVSNKTPVGDFTLPVDGMLLNYIKAQWISTDPAKSTAPPTDFKNKVRFGDFPYDGFCTYYIQVKESVTTIDNDLIMEGIFQMNTRVYIDLTARRLSKGENFNQLNNMREEVIRIFGNYRPDNISGIHGIDIERPGERDIEQRVFNVNKSVWYLRITANVMYIKYYYLTA